uniref:DUF2769 domain-containing protein n=1 Tax=Angiostrongylus cantonensis TaxID=6313 RepID=A0A0K0CYE5_ANGCA
MGIIIRLVTGLLISNGTYPQCSIVPVCLTLPPRGIGLIRLPFGTSDHRSGPYLPNLYMAGNKLYHRTQTIPDVSLPGQEKDFSGHAQLNPFTHMTGVAADLDFGDSWGAGYGIQGVNFLGEQIALGLNLRKNYRQYAEMPELYTDGMHQPFQNSFIVGAEFDFSKYVSHAVALDVPLPGLNEMFDFQEEMLTKRDEELTDIHHTRFSLPIPSTNQRLPFKVSSKRSEMEVTPPYVPFFAITNKLCKNVFRWRINYLTELLYSRADTTPLIRLSRYELHFNNAFLCSNFKKF